MDIILIIAAVILTIVGIIGSVVPVLPGPPLNFLALLIVNFIHAEPVFSNKLLIVLGLITLIVVALDMILPLVGAKAYGASKFGLWGAAIGMLLGVFFLPPLGLIVGAMLGAIVGELMIGQSQTRALKAGLATVVGNLVASIFKFTASIVMAVYFFSALL